MDLKECYDAMGGNYGEILYRLKTEDRVVHFLSIFLKDPSFTLLEASLEKCDWAEAFRAAHSLKGICMNLALSALQEPASRLTENLRGGHGDEDTEALFQKTEEEYIRSVSAIRRLTGAPFGDEEGKQ